jgi:hypothetical protein
LGEEMPKILRKMKENNHKRAAAYRVRLLPISGCSDASVYSIFSDRFTAGRTDSWLDPGAASVEFNEKQVEDEWYFEIELKISITDTSSSKRESLSPYINVDCIAMVDYTDGESRLVGSSEAPLIFTLTSSGTPEVLQLSCKMDQPVQTRRFQSF